MLSLEECREILQAYLDEQNKTKDHKVGLTGWHDEGKFCFAFGVNSKKFIETGDSNFCLVGGGPTLIDRRSGKIIPMANNGTMENYEKRGDPYNGLSSVLRITGDHKAGARSETHKYFRLITKRSIAECGDIVDSISNGETYLFDTKGWRDWEVVPFLDSFQGLGYTVKRLTDIEARLVSTKDNWLEKG